LVERTLLCPVIAHICAHGLHQELHRSDQIGTTSLSGGPDHALGVIQRRLHLRQALLRLGDRQPADAKPSLALAIR
jgi:hypothetical protein